MPQVHIEITNLPQIKAAFNKAPRLMKRNFEAAIRAATLLVEGKSKINTPVLTGFLRNSHTTRFSGSALKHEGTIEPTAKYAMFVHQGTRFQKAQPFLKDAADSSENDIERIFEGALQNVLNEIGRMV